MDAQQQEYIADTRSDKGEPVCPGRNRIELPSQDCIRQTLHGKSAEKIKTDGRQFCIDTDVRYRSPIESGRSAFCVLPNGGNFCCAMPRVPSSDPDYLWSRPQKFHNPRSGGFCGTRRDGPLPRLLVVVRFEGHCLCES